MAEKKKTRYGAWIIVGGLLLGLAGFGSSGLSSRVHNIGTVGDKAVTVASYQRALNEQIRATSRQLGQQVTFEQAQALGLDQFALNQVVLLRTLDNEASQLGVSVGDATVFERLQAIPSFQSAGGFNRNTYRAALQQVGQTTEEFETGVREETARSLLQGAVVGGVSAPDVYADTLVAYVSETRAITWAIVDATNLSSPVPAATAEAQQAYYDANSDEFTLPESRNITYVWLAPTMILDQMDVSDVAIKQLYDDRSDQYLQPGRRLVERLVYLDQESATAALARVKSGEIGFEGLVAERGLTLSDVDMGDIAKDELFDAGDAVFAAGVGDVVGPLETLAGPALFRINAVLAAQETALDDVAAELREELAVDAARSFIADSADGITDLLAGGATLEDLAERTDLRLATVNWTADVTEDIAAYDAFRNAAADAEAGQFPQIFDLSDGGIFALRLDGITPPTLQPLDDVRDAVAAAWQAQARQEAIVARANEIAADILPLTGFDTLGLTPQREENLSRRSFVDGAPSGFNDEIFGMDIGAVRVVPADDQALIVRLEDIKAPDTTDEGVAAQRETLAQNVRAGIAQDLFDAYVDVVQRNTDQTLNQQTIAAVNAQLQ